MTVPKIRQRPLRLDGVRKFDVRTQFGALPWRIEDGQAEVLLVTGRKSRKWGIPKGWPLHRTTPAKAAAREAWEEAGAEGKTSRACLGIYSRMKKQGGGPPLPCVVAVFPVQVRRLADTWPESSQRRRKWFTLSKAAKKVRSPELKRMIRDFDPASLPA